ncbi:Anaphase-promoting complex subunit 1, partial [Cladochytrium tenue]
LDGCDSDGDDGIVEDTEEHSVLQLPGGQLLWTVNSTAVRRRISLEEDDRAESSATVIAAVFWRATSPDPGSARRTHNHSRSCPVSLAVVLQTELRAFLHDGTSWRVPLLDDGATSPCAAWAVNGGVLLDCGSAAGAEAPTTMARYRVFEHPLRGIASVQFVAGAAAVAAGLEVIGTVTLRDSVGNAIKVVTQDVAAASVTLWDVRTPAQEAVVAGDFISVPLDYVFVTHGEQLLWVLSRRTRRLLAFPLATIGNAQVAPGPVQTFDAADAIPVFSTRRSNEDVVILDPDGHLGLWCGGVSLVPTALLSDVEVAPAHNGEGLVRTGGSSFGVRVSGDVYIQADLNFMDGSQVVEDCLATLSSRVSASPAYLDSGALGLGPILPCRWTGVKFRRTNQDDFVDAPFDRIRLIEAHFKDLHRSSNVDMRHALGLLEKVEPEVLATTPFGVALPIWDVIVNCRQVDTPGLASKRPGDGQDWGKIYDGSLQRVESLSKSLHEASDEVANARFGDDDRVEVVQKLLTPEEAPFIDVVFEDNAAGLFEMHSSRRTLPDVIALDELVIAAKMPPANEHIVLDPSLLEEGAADWSLFHSGVAAGLRIPPGFRMMSSNWIVQNRPQTPNAGHGGFLLGLGLNGHLKELRPWQVFDYFKDGHELTTVGLVLGLATSYQSTCDEWVSRLLTVHIPQFLQKDGHAIKYSAAIHTAAVAGLGFLHCGSQSRRYSEPLLNELASPSSWPPRSGEPLGGGSDDTAAAYDEKLSERHSLAAGFAVGMVWLGAGTTADPALAERLRRLASTAGRARALTPRAAHSARLAAPGASVALALTFLRSGDTAAADALRPPESAYQLGFASPALIALQTACRNLVLWAAVEPSARWLAGQLPDYVRREGAGVFEDTAPADTDGHAFLAVRYAIVAGCALALGLRFAGSADVRARAFLKDILDGLAERMKTGDGAAGNQLDRSSRQAAKWCHNVALVSLAAVMAGTGDLDLLVRLNSLSVQPTSDDDDDASGTGGGGGGASPFACHVARSLALGLLFLGGGSLTLGTSDRGVAALLCALCPRLPGSPADAASHLHALRHVWALAVESRCLLTRDVDSAAICRLPVTVEPDVDGGDAPSTGTNLTAPIGTTWTPFVSPAADALRVRLASDRYWPRALRVDFGRHATAATVVIPVKRKAGHLSYERV